MDPLILDDHGTFLGKHSERLVVRRGKEVLREVPLFQVGQVLITTPGASLSAAAVHACVEHGITITFLGRRGEPLACLSSPALTATVRTRREQLAAYEDERGAALARRLSAGKARNQMNLLRSFAKYRRARHPEVFAAVERHVARMAALLAEFDAVPETRVEAIRARILNLEGRAAAHYWEGVRALLAGRCDFPGREHQGTADPVNAMLNYGYGVLYSQAWQALTLAGLEPFAGFLHVDRPGKPSLVLDFVEEFRAPVVDRTVLAMLGKGFRPRMIEEGEGVRLAPETRRELAARVLARLEDRHPYEGKRCQLRTILARQAGRLAVFLRREGDYQAFVLGW
ncbi:MAG: CRISPR-associated endonuclease Cas1 [Armatimonadetes bacterium]|nr:CRISPR-associated endonuclease Cas1 [Armatimonadota bacterium]